MSSNDKYDATFHPSTGVRPPEETVDYGTTAAEVVGLGPELVKYQHYMNRLPGYLTVPQRLQRRAGFAEGLQRARTMELEAGVVRVKISAETIERCAENLYDHCHEGDGAWPAWDTVSEFTKDQFRSDVQAVFAVLPMEQS